MTVTVKPSFSVPFKSYEELSGGGGRQIFFRAPRLRARELFEQESARAEVNGNTCDLYDLSISGLSVISPSEDAEAFGIGTVVPVAIRRAREPLFSGQARIVRVEPSYRGTKVGVRFVDTIANIDEIRSKYSEQIFAEEADAFSLENVGEVDAAYRVMCTQILEFVREYQADLSHAERLNPRLATDPGAQKRLLDLCEARAIPHWENFALRGNALIKSVEQDALVLAAMKKLTIALLTPEFINGPVWWRSYMKPFGYPGDFMMMNYIYSGEDAGDSLYARFLHRVGCRLSHFIFTRMEYVRSRIRQVVDEKNGEPVRILSLACGAAEELVSYLAMEKTGGPLHITLVDQDARALSYAYERAYPHIARRGDGSTLECLHTSFTKLLKGGDLEGKVPEQDLIYSIGLLDYLKPRRAKILTESLFDKVVPGGSLVIANLREAPNNYRWFAEMLADWDLIFRTEEEMIELGASLAVTNREISIDSTEQVYLMALRKA